MRKILRRVSLLKNLQLMAEEWDIIIPYDVLHQLWDEACHWVDGIHFDLTLTVDYRLIVNLLALQDSSFLVAPEDGHCTICLQALLLCTMVRL